MKINDNRSIAIYDVQLKNKTILFLKSMTLCPQLTNFPKMCWQRGKQSPIKYSK